MEQQRIGYCAILLVIIFGVVAFLSFMYLYLYCSQLRDEQNAIKTRTAEFVRADQVPAIIHQSESILRLQDSIQQINHQQSKNMTNLEKRMQGLLSLGQKQQQLFDALNERRQQPLQPPQPPDVSKRVMKLSSSLSSSDEDDQVLKRRMSEKISSDDEDQAIEKNNLSPEKPRRSSKEYSNEYPQQNSKEYPARKFETMSIDEQERRLTKKLARKAKAKLVQQ